MKFNLTANPEQMLEFLEAGKKAIPLALKYTATEVWGNIRREAPTDHGRLAGSFEMEQAGDNWRIYSNVEYALNVHEGTGIHGPEGKYIEIFPVNKKALYWPGAPHPVKRVLHPGQKGNPYADRAMDAAEHRTGEFIEKAIAETVGSVA